MHTSEPLRYGSKKRIILSLKRENLQTSDFLDISERQIVRLNMPIFLAGEGAQIKTSVSGRPLFNVSRVGHLPGKFPPNSKGFLYFHIPPGQSSISGELRFRLTPTKNPASFDEGHDLTRTNGFHWRVQSHAMPEALRNFALRDQVVTPAVITEWEQLSRVAPSATALYYLEQPFFLDFAYASISMVCVHNGDIRRVYFYNPTRDLRGIWQPRNHHGIAPYTGRDRNLPYTLSKKSSHWHR